MRLLALQILFGSKGLTLFGSKALSLNLFRLDILNILLLHTGRSNLDVSTGGITPIIIINQLTLNFGHCRLGSKGAPPNITSYDDL